MQKAAELGGAAFAADITEAEAAQSLVERVAGELGGLNILVNNAGITIGEQFVADMVLADWRRVLDANLNRTRSSTSTSITLRADWRRVLDANLNSVLYMCEVAAACGLSRVASG